MVARKAFSPFDNGQNYQQIHWAKRQKQLVQRIMHMQTNIANKLALKKSNKSLLGGLKKQVICQASCFSLWVQMYFLDWAATVRGDPTRKKTNQHWGKRLLAADPVMLTSAQITWKTVSISKLAVLTRAARRSERERTWKLTTSYVQKRP